MKKSIRKILHTFWVAFLFLGIAGAQEQTVLLISPQAGGLETQFQLDASQSLSPDTAIKPAEYRFKASRDHATSSWGKRAVYKFKPTQPGNFRAQVWVRDAFGVTRTTSIPYIVRTGGEPLVRIQASTTRPVANEAVQLTAIILARPGLDRQSLQSRWDYDSDGKFDTRFTPGLSGSFRYLDTPRSPTVEVRWPDGATKKARGILIRPAKGFSHFNHQIPTPIQPGISRIKNPIIQVGSNLKQLVEGQTIKIAGISQAGTTPRWFWNNTQLPNPTWNLELTLNQPGKNSLRLQVCPINFSSSKGGQGDACRHTLLTLQVRPLTTDTSFQIRAYTPYAHQHPVNNHYLKTIVGDELKFNLYQLQSSGITQWEYRWDWESDGQFDTLWDEEPYQGRKFYQTGRTRITAQARPINDPSAVESAQIGLIVEGNTPPTGRITPRGNILTTKEPTYFDLHLYDPQTPNWIEARIDSEGDGRWDGHFRRQSSWWWQYQEPGDYLVTMQLRDPQGLIRQVQKSITIQPRPNTDVKVAVSHHKTTIHKPIRFDASSSTGSQLHFEWKFTDQYQVHRTGPLQSFYFSTPGSKIVQLTVTDYTGAKQTIPIHLNIFEEKEDEKSNIANQISSQNITNPGLNFWGIPLSQGWRGSQSDPFAVSNGTISRKFKNQKNVMRASQ